MTTIWIDTKKKRLAELTEEYEVLMSSLGQIFDPVKETRLKRQAKAIEQEIQDLSNEIKQSESAQDVQDRSSMFVQHHTLEDKDWDLLISRMKRGLCTPILGADINNGSLSVKSYIAQQWAEAHNYPLTAPKNLARVAQYLAATYDALFPREELANALAGSPPPNASEISGLYAALASLPLPIFITTNYDDGLTQALRAQGKRPIEEMCLWHKDIQNVNSFLRLHPDFEPDADTPLVFYLLGAIKDRKTVKSMVLTEDDYLRFLVNVAKDPNILPERIQESLGGTVLLFLGYRIHDWDLRVVLHTVNSFMQRSLVGTHISVQLTLGDGGISDEQKMAAQTYLNKYFEGLQIRVYWGTSQKFLTALTERMGN